MKIQFLSLIVFLSVLLVSCSKDENNESGSGTTTTVKTTFTGRVYDEAGNPLSGAAVSAGSQTTTTNIWGIFVLEDILVASNRPIVTVEMPGYWKHTGTFHPQSNGVSSTTVSLFSDATTHTLTSSTGGTITTATGASVIFPADAFETTSGTSYSGTVQFTMHHLPVDADRFLSKVPGTDFKGKKTDDTFTNLISFGMLGVKMKDGSGNELKLKSGKKATINVPVATTQQSTAASTIPLWHFNETTAVWKEEGAATLNGTIYTGEVSHFSWWNCDMPGGAYLSGYVKDCNGFPVFGADVYLNNYGWSIYTDISGYYAGYCAPNTPLNVFAEYYDLLGNSYTTSGLSIPSLAPGSSYTAPDLIFTSLGCGTRISGTTVDCNAQNLNCTVLLIKDNQLQNYCYTVNGEFSFIVSDTSTSAFQIVAYKGLYSNTYSVQAIPSVDNNIGILPVCNQTNINNNVTINFTSVGIGNIPLSLQVSTSQVVQNGSNTEIIMSYYDSVTTDMADFRIITPTYAPGTYNWNGTTTTISGYVYYMGQLFTVDPMPTSGSTTLTNTPAPGGNIIGTFSGPVTLLSTGAPQLQGTLSASFDVYRNN
ncbi:MAG: carboxypeptidase regulatory-like domain-containing protein [Bacteroidia bacterium]|nr:carboxypeptidase regulatory-like domain-containing protein [Bacteroidia bacterium]